MREASVIPTVPTLSLNIEPILDIGLDEYLMNQDVLTSIGDNTPDPKHVGPVKKNVSWCSSAKSFSGLEAKSTAFETMITRCLSNPNSNGVGLSNQVIRNIIRETIKDGKTQKHCLMYQQDDDVATQMVVSHFTEGITSIMKSMTENMRTVPPYKNVPVLQNGGGFCFKIPCHDIYLQQLRTLLDNLQRLNEVRSSE